MPNATTALAELDAQRARAVARVEELEREARVSVQAATEASAALAELERVGGSATKRHQLEEALAAAKAKSAEPWAERVAGARAAVRDVDVVARAFTADHFSELLADLEADGRAAAERFNAANTVLIAEYSDRERIAAAISALATQVGHVRPGDVSFSRAEAVVREAQRLAQRGGEDPPVLRRDPRQPVHGQLAEQAVSA